MASSILIDNLMYFNLTRQEASIYVELLSHEQMSGYEVAKKTGIARSNVYTALQSLVEKGAVYIIEGETTKYVPVEAKTFLKNMLSELAERAKLIVINQPQIVNNVDGYITIVGAKNIIHKIKEMLEKTEERLYVMAPKEILDFFVEELQSLVKKSKKVVILSDNFNIQKAIYHKTVVPKNQIRLITDSSYVLTGELSNSEHDRCLYSGQQNLVDVMKEALKNKIELLQRDK